MLFAGAGYNVKVYDILETQIASALVDIKAQLNSLQESNMLRGGTTSDQQFALISGTNDLSEAVTDAVYVQVCLLSPLVLTMASEKT